MNKIIFFPTLIFLIFAYANGFAVAQEANKRVAFNELKIELRDLLKRNPVENLHVFRVSKPIVSMPNTDMLKNCVKLVIWNRAARKVYGGYTSYCQYHPGSKSIPWLEEFLREEGIEEGYNEDTLYELWYE